MNDKQRRAMFAKIRSGKSNPIEKSEKQFQEKASLKVAEFVEKHHKGKIYSDDPSGDIPLSQLRNDINDHIRSIEAIEGQKRVMDKNGENYDRSMLDYHLRSHKLEIERLNRIIKNRMEKLESGHDYSGRSFEKSMFGFEQRTEALKRLAMNRGNDFNIEVGKIIPSGASNLNAPDVATPPDLQYTIYWKSNSPDDIKKQDEFIKYAKSRLDLKVLKRFDSGVQLIDVDVEPTNANFKRFGYDKIDWTKLSHGRTWDDKGRVLGDRRFGK